MSTPVPEPVEGDTAKSSPTRRPLRERRRRRVGGFDFFIPFGKLRDHVLSQDFGRVKFRRNERLEKTGIVRTDEGKRARNTE